MVKDILTSIEDDEEREKLVQAKDADGNCPTLLATMAGGAENAGKLLSEEEPLASSMNPTSKGSVPCTMLPGVTRSDEMTVHSFLLQGRR